MRVKVARVAVILAGVFFFFLQCVFNYLKVNFVNFNLNCVILSSFLGLPKE